LAFGCLCLPFLGTWRGWRTVVLGLTVVAVVMVLVQAPLFLIALTNPYPPASQSATTTEVGNFLGNIGLAEGFRLWGLLVNQQFEPGFPRVPPPWSLALPIAAGAGLIGGGGRRRRLAGWVALILVPVTIWTARAFLLPLPYSRVSRDLMKWF